MGQYKILPLKHFRDIKDYLYSQVVVTPSGCWEWSGGRNGNGYGATKVTGVQMRAHRLSWEITKGPIPPGICVLHSCDNPPCINPDHLWLGTKKDNAQDMATKRRVWCSKTSPEQVAEMKRRYEIGREPFRIIARDYGMAYSAAYKIIRGYAYVNDGPGVKRYRKDFYESPFYPAVLAAVKTGVPLLRIKRTYGFSRGFLEKLKRGCAHRNINAIQVGETFKEV